MKYKIGWQKFESTLEDQLSSPILNTFMEKITDAISSGQEDYERDLYQEESIQDKNFMLPISQQLLEDIGLLSNFECWIGHTNFDITQKVQEKLDLTNGVEILKIISRYRFFVGIGKMFDFKVVRKNIENNIIPKEIADE